MRNTLVFVTIFFLGTLAFPGKAEANDQLRTERAAKLREVFVKNSSPLIGLEYIFLDAAESNDLEWNLLPAITGTESSFAKRMPQGCNNPFGWGITGNNRLCFLSLEEAINKVAEGLGNKYNTQSVFTVAQKYNPANSLKWASTTSFFMRKFENQPISLADLPLNL